MAEDILEGVILAVGGIFLIWNIIVIILTFKNGTEDD